MTFPMIMQSVVAVSETITFIPFITTTAFLLIVCPEPSQIGQLDRQLKFGLLLNVMKSAKMC
jgi:hypothetical protein